MAAPANRLLDFGFAFNDVNFSDRILRIEISSHDLAEQSEEKILDSSMPDLKDGINNGNQEEAVAMIEESSVGTEVTVNEPTETNTCFLEGAYGQEVAKDNEPSYNMERSGIQVRTLHVSAPILAADSPFFYKLFSNGMKESQQQHVTLHIQASEEDALMDLLNFMYRNTLPRTTPTALLNVLVAADKFEVASCMKYCSQLLRTLPMTCESALLYLPTTVLMPDTVQQLIDSARKFLVDHFKDLTKHEEEFLNLPLAGFEAVLSSDDLQVSCEDDVYEIVLKWARVHYPNPEERREMLSKHILRLVRFPWMSCRHLNKVQTCDEIESEVAYKVVSDALLFKAESPLRQRSLAAAGASASSRQFVERPYINKPVKVVELELPRQKCMVYMNLKREECAQLSSSGRINSQAFYLRGEALFLYGRCHMITQRWSHYFELYLGMEGPAEKAGLTVDYDCAAVMKQSENFESMSKGNGISIGGSTLILSMPWNNFIAGDSPHFINGILHLKVGLTIKN